MPAPGWSGDEMCQRDQRDPIILRPGLGARRHGGGEGEPAVEVGTRSLPLRLSQTDGPGRLRKQRTLITLFRYLPRRRATLQRHSSLTTPPAPLRDWSLGRFAVSRRAVFELLVLVALFLAYTVIRAAQETDVDAALAHAHDIERAESWLFAHVEHPANDWLSTVAVLAVPACYFYAVFHYLATPAVLYRSRRFGGWVYCRGYWTIVLASAIALIVYARFPVAPPRLVPGLGSIDIMREFADYGWWGDAASAPRDIGDATNQYAAMPSLHFGWSLWCGIQMWSFETTGWRVAAVVYPTLQVLVLIATANHFLLDVLGGAACVLVALGSYHVRSARSALPVLPPVGFSGPPPEPGVRC